VVQITQIHSLKVKIILRKNLSQKVRLIKLERMVHRLVRIKKMLKKVLLEIYSSNSKTSRRKTHQRQKMHNNSNNHRPNQLFRHPLKGKMKSAYYKTVISNYSITMKTVWSVP